MRMTISWRRWRRRRWRSLRRTRPCTATAVLGEALREANATRQQCEDCIEYLYSKPISNERAPAKTPAASSGPTHASLKRPPRASSMFGTPTFEGGEAPKAPSAPPAGVPKASPPPAKAVVPAGAVVCSVSLLLSRSLFLPLSLLLSPSLSLDTNIHYDVRVTSCPPVLLCTYGLMSVHMRVRTLKFSVT